MNHTFRDLVDIEKLQELTDELFHMNKLPCTIISNKGEILTSSGWPEVCTNFHRKHPEIKQVCKKLTGHLPKVKGKLEESEYFVCPRGLAYVLIPIIIENEQIATISSGHILLEDPNIPTETNLSDFAKKLNLVNEGNIAELNNIHIFTEDQFKASISFISKLALMITDLGLAKMHGLEAMEEWKSLVKTLPEYIALHDLQRKYLFLNHYAEGFSEKDVIGKDFLDFIAPDNQNMVKSCFEECLDSKKPVSYSMYALGDNSSIRKYDNILVPIIENEKVVNIISIARDITEQVNTMEALQKSMNQEKRQNELLRSILESPKGMNIFSLDKNYHYIAFTVSHKETMKQMWNADIKLGMNMLDYITQQDDRLRIKINLDFALKGENIIIIEELGDPFLFRTWWENRYSPMFGDDNIIVGLTVFVTDITKRKQAQQAAIDSEIRLKALIDNVDAIVWGVDSQYRLINFNAQYQERNIQIGGKEFALGEYILDNPDISDHLRKEWMGYHKRVMQGEQIVIEKPSIIPGKAGVDMISMRPIRNNMNAIEGMAIIQRDITDQKTIESTLLFLAQNRFIDSTYDFFSLLAKFLSETLSMDFVCINRLSEDKVNIETLTVYFDGNFDKNIIYPIIGTPCQEVVDNNICCISSGAYKLFNEHKIIQEIKAEGYLGTVLLNSSGKTIGLIAMFSRKPIVKQALAENVLKIVSVTTSGELDRIHAMNQVLKSEERFRSLYEAAMDPIMLLDESFRFTDCNTATVVMFAATSKEQIINKHPSEISPEFQPDGQLSYVKANQLIEHALKEGSIKFEWLHKRFDDQLITMEISLTVIPEENKKVLLVHGRDVTERKNYTQNLAKQTEELKSSNAAKDKFFSIIAHDLKNPFNSILGFTDLMLNDFQKYSSQEIFRYLGHIGNSSKQAYALLENLLIWARTQRGNIDFQPEVIDLNPMFVEIINLLEAQAKTKNIRFTYNLFEHYIVFADRNMIETIFRNLLTNAIKFTHQNGLVTINAINQEFDVEISVKDTGIGISHENLESIFNIDSKTNTLGTEKEKGSGLGLILCKEFVEKHGGKIWCESEPGKGSTFYITLPRA